MKNTKSKTKLHIQKVKDYKIYQNFPNRMGILPPYKNIDLTKSEKDKSVIKNKRLKYKL